MTTLMPCRGAGDCLTIDLLNNAHAEARAARLPGLKDGFYDSVASWSVGAVREF